MQYCAKIVHIRASLHKRTILPHIQAHVESVYLTQCDICMYTCLHIVLSVSLPLFEKLSKKLYADNKVKKPVEKSQYYARLILSHRYRIGGTILQLH